MGNYIYYFVQMVEEKVNPLVGRKERIGRMIIVEAETVGQAFQLTQHAYSDAVVISVAATEAVDFLSVKDLDVEPGQGIKI